MVFPKKFPPPPFLLPNLGVSYSRKLACPQALASKGALRPLAKAMGMAYNRGRESSLAPMGKERGMSNAG